MTQLVQIHHLLTGHQAAAAVAATVEVGALVAEELAVTAAVGALVVTVHQALVVTQRLLLSPFRLLSQLPHQSRNPVLQLVGAVLVWVVLVQAVAVQAWVRISSTPPKHNINPTLPFVAQAAVDLAWAARELAEAVPLWAARELAEAALAWAALAQAVAVPLWAALVLAVADQAWADPAQAVADPAWADLAQAVVVLLVAERQFPLLLPQRPRPRPSLESRLCTTMMPRRVMSSLSRRATSSPSTRRILAVGGRAK